MSSSIPGVFHSTSLILMKQAFKGNWINKEFELHTDASGVAVRACLMQHAEHTPYAIAYYSRKLRSTETRYPTIDLKGVRVFDPYLYGRL